MNKLLKEFLSYILINEAQGPPKPTKGNKKGVPDNLYHRGKGMYYDSPTGGVYMGTTASGKWVPASAADATPSGADSSTATAPTPNAITKPTGKTGAFKTFSSGVNIFDKPVTTPAGNKLVGQIPKEVAKEMYAAAREEISRRTASDDRVPDMSPEQLEEYRSGGILGPNGQPETDDQFRERMKSAGVELVDPPRTMPDDVKETMRKAGVPERHIQIIERAMNVVRQGDKPPLSLIINGSVGAGTSQSQTGEVLTLALIAVPPAERARVIGALTTTPPPPRKKKGEPAPPAPPDTILNNSWVESATAQAEAFTSMMDREHGPGNWSVETTGWDTPGDISGVGLTEETKGFSTDGVVRIKVKGESRVVRLSMKKDGNVYLLNGAANDVNKYALQTLTPEERDRHDKLSHARRLLKSRNSEERKAGAQLAKELGIEGSSTKQLIAGVEQEVQNLDDEAISRLPEETQQAIRTVRDYPARQQESAIGLGRSVTSAEGTPTDDEVAAAGIAKKEVEFAKEAHRRLSTLTCAGECTEAEMQAALKAEPPKGGIIGGDADQFRKAMLFAARIEAQRGTPEQQKQKQEALKAHIEITNEAKRAYMRALVGSQQGEGGPHSRSMMEGLMVSLEEKFPLSVIAGGTESMVVGGVPMDRATCREMFGTDDPEELQRSLDLVEDADGNTMLVVRVGERQVPLAIIDVRERGIGYSGNMTVGYDMAPEFECRAAAANMRLGNSNPANDEIANSDRCKKYTN